MAGKIAPELRKFVLFFCKVNPPDAKFNFLHARPARPWAAANVRVQTKAK